MSTYKGRANKKKSKVNQQLVQPAKFSIRHFCQERDCSVELMYLYVTRCGAATTIKTNSPEASYLKMLLNNAASTIARAVTRNLLLLPGQQPGKPLTVQVPLQTGEVSLHRIPPPTRG